MGEAAVGVGETDSAPPPEASFTVRYEARLVRRAVRLFMVRRLFGTPAFFVGMLGLAVLAAFGAGGDGWALGAAAFFAALTLTVTGVVWLAHLRSSLSRLRSLSPPEAEVTVDAERLRFRSSLGEAALVWSVFTEVWRTDDFWMLFSSQSGFNILPVAGVDAAALDALTRRLPPTCKSTGRR